MIYNGELWWDSLYGPSSLILEIKKEIKNKKNVIISCDDQIPWDDYFFKQIQQEHYTFKIDGDVLSYDSIHEGSTILKEILELNGIGYQYKGEKNSIKYLNSLDSEYIKLYYIKDVPVSKVDEIVNLMKSMSNDSKVLIIATLKIFPIQGGKLKVKKINDFITINDKIRFLKLVSQNKYSSSYINDYIAELVGRIEISLENAVKVVHDYCLGQTYDFEQFNDNQKKLVWESQLLVFFPLLEKKRYEFIIKYYDKINAVLPINDVFGNKYQSPDELEIGHIMRLINQDKIIVMQAEKRLIELYYDIRNKLAHQKIVDEIVFNELF